MQDESTMDTQNGPGNAAYSPSLTEPDSIVILSTRRNRASNPLDFTTGNPPGDLLPPNPAEGGMQAPLNQLGFSNGFLAFRRRTPFTGRTLVRQTMGAHPNVGPVGLSTRSQRLRNGVMALQNDYTPNAQSAANEIIRNV